MRAISPRTDATSARGIGGRANRKLHVTAERVRDVVQHAIGKLAERLVGVNERLRAERPVGDVGHHADDREPGIRVLRYVEPPPQSLADGVLPGPEPLGEPLVDDDDAAGFDDLHVGEYPSGNQAHPERLDERTVDPREVRACRSPGSSQAAFGGERSPLVSLERKIGDERRRTNARQR